MCHLQNVLGSQFISRNFGGILFLKRSCTFHDFLACFDYNEIRQRYFSGLGLPLTVNPLLNGKPEEGLAVNNAIFRRVQLYIMATKRFA